MKIHEQIKRVRLQLLAKHRGHQHVIERVDISPPQVSGFLYPQNLRCGLIERKIEPCEDQRLRDVTNEVCGGAVDFAEQAGDISDAGAQFKDSRTSFV